MSIRELSVELMTEIELSKKLATYTRVFDGLRAKSVGFLPTLIISITELSKEFMTDMVLDPKLET